MTSRLCVKGLVFRRGGRIILDHVDLEFGEGEILALLGGNGAGKTTLLRCMLGLLRPDAGSVELDGQPLGTLNHQKIAATVAYVPQAHIAPFPYTVDEVVTLGRLPHRGLWGRASARDRRAVEDALRRMGIEALRYRIYTELSGGERQLVLIARALAQEAKLIVMDEPVSGLDFGHQTQLLVCLDELAAQGIGILKTTHHPEHALFVATRVALLENGSIQQNGKPQTLLTPEGMERLYGVRVEVLTSTNGGKAFVPVFQRTGD
ncbi:MAG: ABC transporter ATP-binding protein [Zoogloeaceae bacterium]|jgi:iron complex transport system ATP-binding protein|nr:ABC transporter ATP-binding protein [Zoogloeaceae bacterium]